MISNQILQNTIDGLKTISKTDFCVADVEGKVVVQTFPEPVSNELEISSFARAPADSQTVKDYQFFKVYDEQQLEYILIAGGGEDVHMVGKMAAFQIQNLLIAYRGAF